VAVPFTPYQQKQWNRQWSGAPVPYRPRGAFGYTGTNTVAGVVPGIGVSRHASFRERTWSDGGAIAGGSVLRPSAVPVSKADYGTGGRRRDATPTKSISRPASGTAASPRSAAPTEVPARPRAQSSARPTPERKLDRPEARPSRPAAEAPAVTKASSEPRNSEPVLQRREPEQPRATAAPAPAARQQENRASPPPSAAAGGGGRRR
jgi:hypothetical protein